MLVHLCNVRILFGNTDGHSAGPGRIVGICICMDADENISIVVIGNLRALHAAVCTFVGGTGHDHTVSASLQRFSQLQRNLKRKLVFVDARGNAPRSGGVRGFLL